MFGSADLPRYGVLFLHEVFRYFAQLAFSYPATLLASIPLTALLARYGFSGDDLPGVHFAGFEILAGASLGLLGSSLRNFERATFERCVRIRLTIGDSLQVSPAPELFCGEYVPSRTLPLLPPGTVVEKLDGRACRGNDVVAADTPPPRTRDHYSLIGVEKIRVVEGIDTGLVGWVLVSGLSNTE